MSDLVQNLYGVFEVKGAFYRKLGVYLREITDLNCKFKVKRISDDFIVLQIYYPFRWRKGIKIKDFLDFFGKEYSGGGVVKSELCEDGEDPRSEPPGLVFGGDVGGS